MLSLLPWTHLICARPWCCCSVDAPRTFWILFSRLPEPLASRNQLLSMSYMHIIYVQYGWKYTSVISICVLFRTALLSRNGRPFCYLLIAINTIYYFAFERLEVIIRALSECSTDYCKSYSIDLKVVITNH